MVVVVREMRLGVAEAGLEAVICGVGVWVCDAADLEEALLDEREVLNAGVRFVTFVYGGEGVGCGGCARG